MGEIITTFEPQNSGAYTTLFMSAAIALAALLACIWMLRKKGDRSDYNQRMLIAMLLFFTVIIGAGTALFTGLSIRTIGTVTIYENGISTSKDSFRYSDIREARIIADKEASLINPGQTTRTTELLLITTRTDRSIALSEEDYPIKAILTAIKRARDKKEK